MEIIYNKYFIRCIILSCITYVSAQDLPRKFPKGLIFGAATSSYQVEGAWDADGKTQSILDYIYQNSLVSIAEGHNGNVATNSYYLYERDVGMMRELGLDFYRFSLSWPRLLPHNYSERINPAGVKYYNSLIDEMLKYGIEPVVTLYHWDLPLELSHQGGWTNPQIVDWFSDFARTAFEQFGDRVKDLDLDWITLNEPQVFCYYRHGEKIYECMKNCLLAHAKWMPWGFYKLLTKIREEYDNPPVFISENGFATHGGLDDQDRIKYYETYLCAMLDAIDEGSDIQAYTAWSLMDNFEWAGGYKSRFGLYEVDYESEELTRTPRASAYMYQDILRTRAIICGT